MSIKINVFSENLCPDYAVKERKFVNLAKKIFKFYMAEIGDESCLADIEYDTVTFDFVYCDSKKTHEINREYREKDYPADIITFAIFADTPEKFVFDGEVNLGEVLIALDKVQEEAEKKGTNFDCELAFLISHGIMHLLGFDHQTEKDYNFVIKMQNKAKVYYE